MKNSLSAIAILFAMASLGQSAVLAQSDTPTQGPNGAPVPEGIGAPGTTAPNQMNPATCQPSAPTSERQQTSVPSNRLACNTPSQAPEDGTGGQSMPTPIDRNSPDRGTTTPSGTTSPSGTP
ncbi:MAG TPA: hypothetical protein V6D19_01910 [Stenomitos sp.]